MKNWLWITIVVAGLSSCGKKNNLATSSVPEPVVSSFNERYAGSTKVRWEKNRYGLYNAKFKDEGLKKQAYYDEEGNLVRTYNDCMH